MSADVQSAEAIQKWIGATADKFGGIDGLMTNSGGPPAGLAISFDDKAWQDAAELLLFSTIRMVRAAVPSMKSRGGGAILVSTSSSVKEPVPNLGLSTVLRASVSALAKTLAIELAPSKIRVNQIIPGRIDTDRVRHLDEVNAQKQGVSVEEAKAQGGGGDSDRTLWGRTRVRPRRRVSPLGRGVVHDWCDRAGGRRLNQERAVAANQQSAMINRQSATAQIDNPRSATRDSRCL